MPAAAHQSQVSIRHGLIDAVPAEVARPRFACGTMARAQLRILDVGAQGFGELMDRAGSDEAAGDVIVDEAFASRSCRSDHRKCAGHRFQSDVAERFGDGGIEQNVHRRHGATEIGPLLETHEDRIGRRQPVERLRAQAQVALLDQAGHHLHLEVLRCDPLHVVAERRLQLLHQHALDRHRWRPLGALLAPLPQGVWS